MHRRASAGALAVALLLVAGCGTRVPGGSASVAATPTPTPTAASTPTLRPSPSATASRSSTPSPSASPTPSRTPSTSPSTRNPASPSPTPSHSGTTSARELPGFGKTVQYRSSGVHVTSLQTLLKRNGYYSGSIDGDAGVGTINGIVNFQRAQSLTDNGIAGSETWEALADPAPVPTALPDACYGPGVHVCVSRAQRKLFHLVDGDVRRTLRVRVGGFTDGKDGTMRVHQTDPGTYTVFRKDPNPSSARYGEGAMPYSVMFDPMMYIHYSAGFDSIGYLGGSHGCVNIGSLSDAKWVYNNTPVGATVIVY